MLHVKSWTANKNMTVKFNAVAGQNSTTLNLNNYIDITKIDIWQKAMIPLDDFGFTTEGQVYLNKLTLTAGGSMGVWLDDIELVIGTSETETIAVCAPTMTSNYSETKTMKVTDIRPNMKGRMSVQPSARIIHDGLRPFPGPTVT